MNKKKFFAVLLLVVFAASTSAQEIVDTIRGPESFRLGFRSDLTINGTGVNIYTPPLFYDTHYDIGTLEVRLDFQHHDFPPILVTDTGLVIPAAVFVAWYDMDGEELFGTNEGSLYYPISVVDGGLVRVFGDVIAVVFDGDWYKVRQIRIMDNNLISLSVPVPEEITVYPNPTTAKVNLKTSANVINCKLIDMSGRLVYEHTINPGTSLDVSSIERGVYFLFITSQESRLSEVHKLIIQ